jgi:hypothetical protein
MRQDELEEQTACAECGALIASSTGRGFPFGSDGLLCWECARRRGGSYDERQDRWTVPPDVSDLPEED